MLLFIYIEIESKKREECESTFVSTIEELMLKFKEEFKKEKAERYKMTKFREEFEENIFNLIEQTFTKISKRDINII